MGRPGSGRGRADGGAVALPLPDRQNPRASRQDFLRSSPGKVCPCSQHRLPRSGFSPWQRTPRRRRLAALIPLALARRWPEKERAHRVRFPPIASSKADRAANAKSRHHARRGDVRHCNVGLRLTCAGACTAPLAEPAFRSFLAPAFARSRACARVGVRTLWTFGDDGGLHAPLDSVRRG